MSPQQQNTLINGGNLGQWQQFTPAQTWPALSPPKPVMTAPNITERCASWMALSVGVTAWLIVFVSIAVWQVDYSSVALEAFTAGTAVGLWFVRRHELNIRKRQYMADVLASQ